MKSFKIIVAFYDNYPIIQHDGFHATLGGIKAGSRENNGWAPDLPYESHPQSTFNVPYSHYLM